MKKILFAIFCVYFFTAIPNANGQYSNPEVLALFRSSLENLMKGDFENAIADSSRVIRIDPDSAISYTIRARAYYEIDQMDRAIADCTQALSLDPRNISAYSVRANAHMKKGEINNAIGDWNRVLRINPDNADARANLEKARKERDR